MLFHFITVLLKSTVNMNKISSSFTHLSLLSTLMVFSAFFTGCKKDQPDKTYYIRFKYDDKHPEYTEPLSVYASFEHIGDYSCILTESSSFYTMKLQVNDYKPIDTGTYQIQGLGDSTLVHAYIDWNTSSHYSSASDSGNATITILEITSTTVRGTFSGTVTAPGQTEIILREGEFFLQIK